MKKLFFFSVISGGILSWLFFLFLAVFTFSPWVLIKTIDDYFLPSYSIDFSELESTGKVLNRNLKFFNLNIFHNEELLTISLELRGPSSADCVEFINFVLEIAVSLISNLINPV